jgi:hypothetical protein
MHTGSTGFDALAPGAPIGPFRLTVSAAANERYWRAAGVEHPALRAGALYPPIAANLTVLAFQERCPEPVIQTRQRLVCHRRADAGTELEVLGEVTARYDKRGRTYVDIEVTVSGADDPARPLWTSAVTFTPTATLGAPA